MVKRKVNISENTEANSKVSAHNDSVVGVSCSDDITLYWPTSDFKAIHSDIFKWKEGDILEINEIVSLEIGKTRIDCRACIGTCFEGKYVSGTFRKLNKRFQRPEVQYIAALRDVLPSKVNANFRVDSVELAECLFETLWPEYREHFHPHGLVVIAGSTKSGKSEVAKSLALRVIIEHRKNALDSLRADANTDVDKWNGARTPHLVTFEDPIESWQLYDLAGNEILSKEDVRNPLAWLKQGICITPRKRISDVNDLSTALRDARRQTPACFFVGEVRDPKEWEEIFSFASSGHLIIVTTHAGSLVESMLTIMKSLNCKTPQERRYFASNLAGCVHLKMLAVPKYDSELRDPDMILPAVWKQCADGVNTMVAEGPSSITLNGEFIFGRKDYLQRLVTFLMEQGSPKRWITKKETTTAALKLALTVDLQEIIGK